MMIGNRFLSMLMGLLVFPGFAACSGEAETEPPTCVTGSADFPRALALPNPEPNGVFDPNLAYDPDSGRLWMAYSGVTGPAGSGWVSTHLSYSDDSGLTWCHAGLVNPATLVPPAQMPSDRTGPEGQWNHEVAAIEFDPGADPAQRWRLIWHRYLHIADDDLSTEDRLFQHGWIAQRTAASAEGLLDAPETILFSSLAFHVNAEIENYNLAAAGTEPEKRFDQDPDLGTCLAFSEPGMLAYEGDLYIAMYCFRSAQQQDIVLVRLDHASKQWSYVGTLLTSEHARAIDPALGAFNGADLFVRAGSYRLIVSPTAGQGYLGCLEYEVDLKNGTLTDSNGDGPDPLLAFPKNTNADVIQTGACSYHQESQLGMIVGDTHLSGIQFRLVATGQ